MNLAIDSPVRTDRHRDGGRFLLDSLTRLSDRWKRPLSPKGQSYVERDVGGQMNVSCIVKRETPAVVASCAGSENLLYEQFEALLVQLVRGLEDSIFESTLSGHRFVSQLERIRDFFRAHPKFGDWPLNRAFLSQYCTDSAIEAVEWELTSQLDLLQIANEARLLSVRRDHPVARLDDESARRRSGAYAKLAS